MKDDYLWDGSGETDEEIERLELTLGRLRFAARPLNLPAARRTNRRLMAAAAVLFLALIAGLLFYLNRRGGESLRAPEVTNQKPSTDQLHAEQKENPRDQREGGAIERAPRPERRKRNEGGMREASTVMAREQPPFDLRIGRHIESSQLLLRAFKNLEEGGRTVDVSYEKQRSRRLLEQNILLRRNAETKSLPVGEVLGALEPFLLDIANLPDRPKARDVEAIRERIEKKEIIAELQVYSTVSRAY